MPETTHKKITLNDSIVKFIKTKFGDNFSFAVIRNPKLDHRINCGAGWDVQIKRNGRTMWTKFNNSRMEKENVPSANNILECLLSDAYAYDYSRDFGAFCGEMGYEPYDRYGSHRVNQEALKIFNGCQKIYEDLHELFDDDELIEIDEELSG